ncbi:MAG TPA: hypothetical protein VGM91_06495 [Conexibacter sp.]
MSANETPPTTPDTGALLDAMMTAAGLAPSESERAALITMYEQFRPGVEALYALPEARYESPALVFQAAPPLAVWGA